MWRFTPQKEDQHLDCLLLSSRYMHGEDSSRRHRTFMPSIRRQEGIEGIEDIASIRLGWEGSESSGCLICTDTLQGHCNLRHQFQGKTIQKSVSKKNALSQYIAIESIFFLLFRHARVSSTYPCMSVRRLVTLSDFQRHWSPYVKS